MIRALVEVIGGEGWRSALRRSSERVDDAWRDLRLRFRGSDAPIPPLPVLNYAPTGLATRLGGLQVQLANRLRYERQLRPFALLRGNLLETAAGALRVSGLEAALALTRARCLHVEGSHGVNLDALLRLADRGQTLMLSLHDFELCAQPQAQALLDACQHTVFPSRFLREAYASRYRLGASSVIAPGIADAEASPARGRALAFAGAIKPHKGAALLPQLAAGHAMHVFGGGDRALFAQLRAHRNLRLHGYYRAGQLPALLRAQGIGLLVLPSQVPETFCLVISEAWQAGAAVACLDHGAQAQRIREHGGGWIARDAQELSDILRRWREGEFLAPVVPPPPLASAAAGAYAGLYAGLGLVD